MKLRISILTLLFGFFSIVAAAQSTQSDYEIQKSFKEKYADYEERVEEVSSPDSANALIASIKELDQEYTEHSDLLNKALYPETYSQKIEDLKKSSVLAMERLTTIKEQTKKLDELETQVSDYEQNLQQLNHRTDSLQQAMEKSVQNEKQLSNMVREYRQNLEDRDELILAFIDSMVVAYQKMDLEAMQDLENIDKKSRIESEGDALEMIHEISIENLNILQKNNDRLKLQDYMRMAEVQQQFEYMWTRLGDKIQKVYDGENAEKMAGEIDENISQWNQTLKTQTFAVLRDNLAQNNIEISDFNTSDELYNSIHNYIDKQITASKENASEATYQKFKDFKQFWNQVEVRWSNNFADAGIIEEDQMATINQKVDAWGQNAQPESANWLVYLLGASVLLAVALGVMLVREKQNKSQT
jgi:hypothetical protein